MPTPSPPAQRPPRVMLAGDGPEVVALCRAHGCGIEIQSFLDSGEIPSRQASLGDLQPRALHGPFGDLCAGSNDPLIRGVTRQRFELACSHARQLQAPDVILHHGYVPGTSWRANWLRRSVEFWRDFLADKESGLRFHVENMLERDAGLLADVMDGIADERVDVCLDIGHCHCHGNEPPARWIERLGPRVGWVHVHDNRGDEDEHLAPGAGTMGIDEVAAALLAHCPQAVWSLEARDEDLPASLAWVAEVCDGR